VIVKLLFLLILRTEVPEFSPDFSQDCQTHLTYISTGVTPVWIFHRQEKKEVMKITERRFLE
jgi:hypothetical protein